MDKINKWKPNLTINFFGVNDFKHVFLKWILKNVYIKFLDIFTILIDDYWCYTSIG